MMSLVLRRAARGATRVVATAAFVAGLSASTLAATNYSKGSGAWEASATWANGVPAASDDVIVLSGHVVTTGNTSANATYTIRSLEVRAGGRVESGTNTFRSYIKTTGNGPTGYAVLNNGQIHNQLNRTAVVECAGNLRTDGSGISNRTSQPMGGTSWGWNNVPHAGNNWPHNHMGNNGDSTPGNCLLLTGGTGSTVAQGGTVNIDNPGGTAGLDALPRCYVKGSYKLASNLEMNAFEQQIELGGALDLNGWRLLVRGPLHVGDTGVNTVQYALATDGNVSTTSTTTNFAGGAIPQADSAPWSGVQDLWTPGSTSSVSYSTAPKKITGAFPSDWVNSQGPTGTFNFYGQNVRDLWVSVNGWVGFLSTYASSYPYNAIPGTFWARGIAIPGGYYDEVDGSLGHRIRAGLYTPASGNREYVVEWMIRYFGSTAYGQLWHQCRLEENTNVIRFRYNASNINNGTVEWSPSSANAIATIGIQDQGGTNGTFVGNSGFPSFRVEPAQHQKFTPQYPTSPAATLTIGNGNGTANQNTWPQFRITAGGGCIWGTGAVVTVPAGQNGSALVGTAVQMYGSAKLQVYGQPTLPSGLSGWSNAGRAPSFWILGFLGVGGTAEVDVQAPSTVSNPYNSMLQVGQALDFLDYSQNPPVASSGHVKLTGNNGAYDTSNLTGPQPFPVLLVQGGLGGTSNFVTGSLWAGSPGGFTPGVDTAGMTITNSTFVHQGGLATADSFQMVASGGNPGSAWGRHSIAVGLAANGTIPMANGTDLEIGGLGTRWSLDGVALAVNGNRQALNGGGGNLFVSNGAVFSHRGIAANLPSDGSLGMVDCNGTLQVTGAAQYLQGDIGVPGGGTIAPSGAPAAATLRVLGQGTLPPGAGLGARSTLQRKAPLGNLSIDDGGSLQSVHPGNVLVFIGEKWHSASVGVKIHPWKVQAALNGQPSTFSATGGNGVYTFRVLSDAPGTGGSAGSPAVGVPSTGSAFTYTAGTAAAGRTGTAVIRVTDGNGEFHDAVVTYGPPTPGPLGLSPGYIDTTYNGYVYYLRTGVTGFTPRVHLNAYAGSGSYSWSVSGNGAISGTSGAAVTFTAGTGGSTGTVVLSDGSATRTCFLYHNASTFYGDQYPTPYYWYHLHVGASTPAYLNPNAVSGTPTWTYTNNATGASFGNGASTATGTSVMVNAGTRGGLTPADFNYYTQGSVVFTQSGSGTAATGYFYFYVTAQPSSLAIGPTLIEGLLPSTTSTPRTYQFQASGGQTPYTWSLAQSGGGGPSVSSTGLYTSGVGVMQDDVVDLTDGWGVSRQAVVRKGLPTPATGNRYTAVPGAKTIFTNSTVSAVDQIIFADVNDDFGRLQVLKTLSSGARVLPASLEVTPVLATVVAGTTLTFSVPGDSSTSFTWRLAPSNSGATLAGQSGSPPQATGNTVVYTAGTTANTTDTLLCIDPAGKLARATINVVSQGGSSPVEIRPRYVYYLKPGQALNLRAVGGKGLLTWAITQNNTGGGLSSTTGSAVTYVAGTSVAGTAVDYVQVADSTGDWDRAWIYTYNYTSTGLYVHPSYAYYDYNTGAGKSRNGFVSGQTLALTTTNGSSTGTWGFTTNASGAKLSGSGLGAIYTAGNTTGVTDYLTTTHGSSVASSIILQVVPPPMGVSPAAASVFGSTTLTFTAYGGGSSKTWSLLSNASGASLSGSSGSSVTYTAGASAGNDVVRVSDGSAWSDVTVSVLSASNPTHLRCSHLDVYHGDLDLNGRPVTVAYNGADPAADGTVIFSVGGITGAPPPRLTSMAASGSLAVGRTLVFGPFCEEFVTAGVITIDGSLKVTEDTKQTTPFNLADSGSTATVIFTGNQPDGATANQVDVWHAYVTGSGSPTGGCLRFANVQRGPGTSTTTVAWQSQLVWNNYATVTPAPAETPSPPTNGCTGGTLPPGFTLYSNPSTQALSGTINSGVWIRSGNDVSTSWAAKSSPFNQCWVVTGTVVINGGLVIENGCVDVQGTLTVNGDVFVGIGTLSQDRTLNPTLRLTTGTPALLIQERTPGASADGSFFHNPGATTSVTRGLLSVDTSCKIADDPGTSPATGRVVDLLGTSGQRVTLRCAGQGQEGGTSARVYRVDATGAAQTLRVDGLHVAKGAISRVVDLQGPVEVWDVLDVDGGTLTSTNAWPLHLRGPAWDTAQGAVAGYGTSFVVWVDGDRSSAAPSGTTAASATVPTVTVQATGTGAAAVLPTTYLDHPGAASGSPPDLVRLGSNVTARNWYVRDGTFAPAGFALATVQDVSIGLGTLATDRANNPSLVQTGGAVLAGRHFLFFPGATEAVDAGTLGAQGDFSVTDDPGTSGSATNRVFDLRRDLAGTVNGTAAVVLSGAWSPARIFRQDPSGTPQPLAVDTFTVQKAVSATAELWSTVDVQTLCTMQSGTLSGINGTLRLSGDWTTTGGAYVNFPAGVTVAATTPTQTFTGVAGSAVPAVQINKSAGVVRLGAVSGAGMVFEVGGNFWIQDGTVDCNGNALRINGDLFQGTPDGSGTIQTSLTRAAEPTLQANDGSASATIWCRRVTAGAGGSWLFYPGARERVEHATVRLERNGFFQDDTSGATGATGRAFDLHRTSPASTSPAVHTTPTVLVLQGPDNGTVWRSDDQTAGLTLDVRDLTVNKVPTAATVAFQTPIQVHGTYAQQSGTVASGTIYANGNWTATGGGYGSGAAVVVQGTGNQTFTSAVILPNVFINKTSGGWVRVPTGQTLQTGHFTIQAGEVDLNGGTLEVNGNFAVGVNGTPNTNGQAVFLCSSNGAATGTASGLGGTLTVKATSSTTGNFWIFNGVTAVIDTGRVGVDGDVFVDDASFAFTDFTASGDTAPGNVLELRNNRGAAAALWSARPAAAPVLACFDLVLDKSGAGLGAQVDVASTVRVANALIVRGTTVVNGTQGTSSPLQVHGPVTTAGAGARFTPVTVLELRGTAAQTLAGPIALPVVYVIKPATAPARIGGTLGMGTCIVQQGTLDLNGGALTVTGWMQVGTGASPAPSPAPTFVQAAASGGGTLSVRAPDNQGASGTLYWLADAQGTLDTGLIDLEGGLDVRSVTWAPAGTGSTHRVQFSGNRSSTVVAASTVQPTGTPARTLVFQDCTVAKTGGAPGDRVDFTASDVAVRGTFTLTSGTVNTDTGAGAFFVKLFGPLAATGGAFTPASWVSFEGAAQQTAGGAGGGLPNVRVNKAAGSLPADEVVFSGALALQSLLVLDGSAVLADPPTGATALTVATSVTVGSGNLSTDRVNAPEFRMALSGGGACAVGTHFNFWAGALESIAGGTLRITGNLQVQDDAAAGGNAFDLSTGSAPDRAVLEFAGNTPGTYYLVAPSGAAQPLGLFDLTIAKTTGVAATATGPVHVGGTLTVQNGLCGTFGAGDLRLRGAWVHAGGAYATGTRVTLDGTGAQALPAVAALPSITIDKASGVASVAPGGAATVGRTTAGELVWVRQGTFDPNGGTLTVHGVFAVGDGTAATSRPTAPRVVSGAAASTVVVRATGVPPAGFAQDGDVLIAMNGTANSPATTVDATTLTAGRWQVGHRLAIDDPNFATGAGFLVQLDGNAGTQGPGEVFSRQPAANPLLVLSHLEVAKTGGGQGAVARLLSPAAVSGNVRVTGGTFDLANQARLDVGGSWTVAAAARVLPTITPVRFVGSTSPVAITIDSATADFFDLVVQKSAGADAVAIGSAATPAQPVVVQRQCLLAQGTLTVTAGQRLTVGAGAWLGTCQIGTGTGSATGILAPGATLAMGAGGAFAVDAAATFVQVGTGAAARARLTSVSPGVARYAAAIDGTWRAQWFEVSSPSAAGLRVGRAARVTGAPQDLSDGLWDWPPGGGVLLDLTATDGTTTKPSACHRNVFANSGGASGAGNVAAGSNTTTMYFLGATGVLAGEAFDVEPSGPAPIYWNVATLQAAVAANSPPATPVMPTQSGVRLGAWTLTETSGGEAADVTALTFTATTGSATTGWTGLRLYHDVDGSGTVTSGDTPLGATVSAFTSGTVAFAGSPLLQVPARGTVALLLVGDTSGATAGTTLTLALAQASDVAATGATSGLVAQVPGTFPSTANTVSVQSAGRLTVALGPESPAAGTVLSGSTAASQNVVMGQWTLAADPLEAHAVSGLTFTDLATGAVAGVTNVRLFLDGGTTPGVLDGSDTLLGSATTWNASRQATITASPLTTLAAGGTRTVILVQDFPTGLATGTAYRVELTSLAATGQASGATSLTSGLPSASTTQTVGTAGSATVRLGPGSPAPTAIVKSATGHVMGQWQVQVSAAESLALSALTVTEAGTATASTAVGTVRCFVDGNGNGAVDPGEPQVGGTATFSGATATLTVSPARMLPAGSTTSLLIVYDGSGNGTAGQTLAATWAGSAALALTGQTSGAGVNAAASPTFPVSGGAWTLTDGPPVLALASGTGDPAAATLPGNQSGVVVAVVGLTASGEPQTVSQLQVSAAGSANDATAVARLRLFADSTGSVPGALDAADTQLGADGWFATDDGTVIFAGLALALGQAAAEDVLVVVDWNAPGLQTGDTFRAIVRAVTATGDRSTLASTVSGLPFTGAAHTVALPGSLAVTPGPRMPPAQAVTTGSVAVPVWQGRVQAGAMEDVRVEALTVAPQGPAPASFFGTLRLFWDADSNGRLDPGVDVLLALPEQLVGTPPVAVFALAPQRVSRGTYQDWLLVADVAGTMGQANALAATAVTARGVTSGLDTSTGLALTGLPLAGGLVTVGSTGSVALYPGPHTSPSRTEPAGTAGIPVAQWTLRASPAEAATLTQVRVTHAGSGTPGTDLAAVRLWVDADGNGRVDAGEVQLGPTPSVAGTTTTFTGLSQAIPAGGDLHVVVTYDLAAGATSGATFRAQLFANADVSVTGQSSGAALPVGGAPVQGGLLTVGTAPGLLVMAGAPWPGPIYRPPASLPAATVVVAALRLEATAGQAVDVLRLGCTAAGSGDDRLVVVRLWADANGDGRVDPGDILLGTTAPAGFPADDGAWSLALSPVVTLGAGSSAQWLLTYDVPAGVALDDTFTARVVPVADVAAVQSGSSTPATVAGPALQSPQLTINGPPSFGEPVVVAAGSRGGGCFVATACVSCAPGAGAGTGASACPQIAGDAELVVAALQGVRDRVLPAGVTAAYYRQSPAAAAALRDAPAAAAAVRGGLAAAAGALTGGAGLLALLAALAAAALRALRRRSR